MFPFPILLWAPRLKTVLNSLPVSHGWSFTSKCNLMQLQESKHTYCKHRSIPRAPPILSRRNEFLAKDKLHDSMLDMILELLPLLSSASSSVWVAQTSSGEINRLLSLTSPTNAKASSMTLYLFPWCSANRIARTRRLCSSLAIAASRSARCCDWTVCRGTTHRL